MWVNENSSRDGVNDRVPVAEANRLSDSSRLIREERLLVSVEPPKLDKTHPVLRGSFRYNGVDYRLKITDVGAEKEVKAYLAASIRSANVILPLAWASRLRATATS